VRGKEDGRVQHRHSITTPGTLQLKTTVTFWFWFFWHYWDLNLVLPLLRKHSTTWATLQPFLL
jgi:hypothetical protein